MHAPLTEGTCDSISVAWHCAICVNLIMLKSAGLQKSKRISSIVSHNFPQAHIKIIISPIDVSLAVFDVAFAERGVCVLSVLTLDVQKRVQ